MKTTNIDKQLEWWNSLSQQEQNNLIIKIYSGYCFFDVSNEQICVIYEQEHKDKDKEFTKTILTPMEFASQLQNIVLEDKYDYVIASLKTLPVGLSDFYSILQILINNKEKHK